jgi:hypothetical protein
MCGDQSAHGTGRAQAGPLDCAVKPGDNNGPQADPLDCPVKPGNDQGGSAVTWYPTAACANP